MIRNTESIADKILIPYLVGLSLLFCASSIAGFFTPSAIRREILELLVSSLAGIESATGGMLFLYILLRNLAVTFLTLLCGLLFGIAPLIVVALNGFVLGVAYAQVGGAIGYWKAVGAVVPHGVLEIPALIVAAGYGLWLGAKVLQRIRGRESRSIVPQLKHALKGFIRIVVPLLIAAAGIETVLILTQ